MKRGETATSSAGPASTAIPARTSSGIDVPTHVGPEGVREEGIGLPGENPYTRGIFADGYQGRMWTIRQYHPRSTQRVRRAARQPR